MTSLNIASRNFSFRGPQGPQGFGNGGLRGPQGFGGPQAPGRAGQNQFDQGRFRDAFEGGPSQAGGAPQLGGVSQLGGGQRLSAETLDRALRSANVTPEQHRAVMQAVKNAQGTPGSNTVEGMGRILDNALKQAGVSPEQHHQVMTEARRPEGAAGSGLGSGQDSLDSGSGLDAGSDSLDGADSSGEASGGQRLSPEVLDNALKQAGVTPEQHKAVMQAVKNAQGSADANSIEGMGKILDNALKQAGVTPEQHHAVMEGARRAGSGSNSSFGGDSGSQAVDPAALMAQINANRLTSSLSSF